MIIQIKGGLGNQMFQYAYGRKLDIIENKKVIFDISHFQSHNSKDTPRIFLLDKFTLAPKIEFKNFKQNFFTGILSKIISKITGDYHYYQSADYFKGVEKNLLTEFTIKKEFQSANFQQLAEEISNSNSLSIHIRRGDYVSDPKTNAYHGTINLEYYSQAIKIIKQKNQIDTLCVFTDDSEWVKNNLKIEEKCIFISDYNLQDYEELILMSKCKHNIIANSSFSWWGAWLNQNPNKIVIAPKQWLKNKTSDELNILPKSWIRI